MRLISKYAFPDAFVKISSDQHVSIKTKNSDNYTPLFVFQKLQRNIENL